MAAIKATCDDCGDVDLTSRDVAIVKLKNDVEHSCIETYAFKCPCCSKIRTKVANEKTVDVLNAVGCKEVKVEFSPESLDLIDKDSEEYHQLVNDVLDALRPTANGHSVLINSITSHLQSPNIAKYRTTARTKSIPAVVSRVINRI